jgi:thiol-disulfide isomerase/thioredoxin
MSARRFIKTALLVVTLLGVLLVGAGAVMYSRNAAPAVPPIPATEAATPSKPYVVKLHAQWCAVCMITKNVWSEIEKTYAGRVNLVVLDFTTDANTEASRAAATRLGLAQFFDEYGGATGTIVVLDGRRKVTASINGSRDFAEYRAAIDAALAAAFTR